MHRLNDLLTPWGGPNADNVYHYAAIDDQSTYRLHGRMGSCEQWLLALRRGNLHQKENGTLGEGSASDFGIGEGDEVDVILSPSGEGGLADPAGHQDDLASRVLLRLASARTGHAAARPDRRAAARPAASWRRSKRPASSSRVR